LRRYALLLGPLALCACGGEFQTVSESPDQVTYSFDPTRVSPDRVSSAATIHCEDSPDGSLRAVAVAETIDGANRVVRYNCTSLPQLDLNQMIDKAEDKLKKDLGQ
jgi:hypothetical protein